MLSSDLKNALDEYVGRNKPILPEEEPRLCQMRMLEEYVNIVVSWDWNADMLPDAEYDLFVRVMNCAASARSTRTDEEEGGPGAAYIARRR